VGRRADRAFVFTTLRSAKIGHEQTQVRRLARLRCGTQTKIPVGQYEMPILVIALAMAVEPARRKRAPADIPGRLGDVRPHRIGVDVEAAAYFGIVALDHERLWAAVGQFAQSTFSPVELQTETGVGSTPVVGKMPRISLEPALFVHMVPHDAEGMKLESLTVASAFVVLGNLRKVGVLLGALLEQVGSVMAAPDLVKRNLGTEVQFLQYAARRMTQLGVQR